jgi:hypothetical protein
LLPIAVSFFSFSNLAPSLQGFIWLQFPAHTVWITYTTKDVSKSQTLYKISILFQGLQAKSSTTPLERAKDI